MLLIVAKQSKKNSDTFSIFRDMPCTKNEYMCTKNVKTYSKTHFKIDLI